MALILTRSPYFVSRGILDNDASLKLEIGSYSGEEGLEVSKTYNLAFRNSYSLDISPLIKDYLGRTYSVVNGQYFSTLQQLVYVRTTLSGSLNGVLQSDVIDEFHCTDGYLFSTDDYNKDFSSDIKDNGYYVGSTDLIYKLDDSSLILRFLAVDVDLLSSPSNESLRIDYLNKGEVIGTETKSIEYDNNLSEQLFKITVGFLEDKESYLDRIVSDSGVFEDNKCLSKFLGDFKLVDLDEVKIYVNNSYSKTLRIKTIEECKYKPYKATFLNRFGVEEDLWFFKRSDVVISTNKEMFRGNSVASYVANNDVKTMQHFNVNGYEKITLNSGFVEEEMNEAFRQLLLSEEITLYDYKENKEYNVNIATSELQYKQHVNDKLINYTIEFEFAHEVINNVG
jgi:hypothetical protein